MTSASSSPFEALSQRISTARENISLYTEERLNRLYSTTLRSPGTVVFLLLILTLFFAQQGLSFQEQIEDDVEIFLPDDAK